MDTIEIANLREYPQFVPVLARWHHWEWLRGYGDGTRNSVPENGDIAADLREREHNLRTHFGPGAVPTTFVALTRESELRPVGSVSIVYYRFTNHRLPSEWLTNLYVLKQYRKQGIGEHLLDYVAEYATEHSINHLKLYTRDREEFYRKRDWRFSHKGLVQGSSVSVLEKWL